RVDEARLGSLGQWRDAEMFDPSNLFAVGIAATPVRERKPKGVDVESARLRGIGRDYGDARDKLDLHQSSFLRLAGRDAWKHFAPRGRRLPALDSAQMQFTALVVDADPPVQGLSGLGGGAKGTVTILVEGGPDGPIYVAREMRLTEDRWLVGGMEIPVSLDPERPERF